jgi:hypothetical protein
MLCSALGQAVNFTEKLTEAEKRTEGPLPPLDFFPIFQFPKKIEAWLALSCHYTPSTLHIYPPQSPPPPPQSKMSANQSMMTAMAELEQSMTQKLTEMRKILGMAELAPIAPKKSAGRPKKVKAEGAEAEKRAPNAFASFVSRVNEQLRAAEEGTEKSAKAKAGTVMQFASYLWAKSHDWEPEAILAERATWEPPAVSKQQLEGKSKRSGSVSSGAPSASGEAEPVSDAPKARKGGKWSEEAKASAAAKRAAKKAAASGAPAEAEEAFEEAEEAAEAPAPEAEEGLAFLGLSTPAKKAPEPAAEPAAPPAPKKALIKPKAAPPAKKLDLSFYSITHEGTDYFTNDRHDLISADMVWVGRLMSGKIVEAEEPADLADAVMREE